MPAVPVLEHSSAQPAGKVAGIHVGGTITVYPGNHKLQIKVRLAGIDALKLKQAYGNAAREAEAELK
ncbi:MAG: hypothetical protein JWM59_4563 [Verrucomicrobiales bacterium]|nr:hypothetical protein [Verrucomicrobiales bacterium]